MIAVVVIPLHSGPTTLQHPSMGASLGVPFLAIDVQTNSLGHQGDGKASLSTRLMLGPMI